MLKNQYQTNTNIFLELFKVYTFGIIMLLCLACLTMLNKILNAKYDTPKFIRGENVLKKKKKNFFCIVCHGNLRMLEVNHLVITCAPF
jgi:hypothetical protein